MRLLKIMLLSLVLVCQSILAKALIFAVPLHPWHVDQSCSNIRLRYQPLQNYLAQRLHRPIVIRGYVDNDKIAEAIAQGKVDFGLLKATAYLQAKHINSKVAPIVTVLTWDIRHQHKSMQYNSYIVTLKKYHNIDDVFDLHDQAFGFVDPYSESGFIYPAAYLAQHGINYHNFFSQRKFYGDHEAVLYELSCGKIKAGSVWDEAYEDAPNRDQFKVLAKIPGVPNPLYVAAPILSHQTFLHLQQALETVPKSVIKGLPYAGFAATPPHFYDRTSYYYRHIVLNEK